MPALVDTLGEIGLANVFSLLQSGNLVFRSRARSTTELERLLETEVAKRLALDTDFFVRTGAEWQSIVARNPFPAEARRDPGRLVVLLLKSSPGAENVESLRAAITGPEIVRTDGRQAYVVYPAGIGRSRLTNALIERKLGTRATARNWNTVQKLAALVERSSA